ncbi:hypothetical protein HMPREF1425_00393 [Helicobacter pylori GAM71Ai]|nr:hypothetical protein HMPREF1425_00393 [Helicobacter pylori GAM71Ai]EMJ45052.1 hypothetical protein HMPREF1434_00143 [Helicobacter pylori GAMchJs124i]
MLTFRAFFGVLKHFKGKSSQIPPIVNETLESRYRLYLYPTHR